MRHCASGRRFLHVGVLIGTSILLVTATGAAEGEPVSLEYALDFARSTYDRINRDVVDYTCVLVRRHRVDGKLTGYDSMDAKIRHQRKADDGTVVPFSVYLHFRTPASAEGREVLYVPTLYRGNLLVRIGGRIAPNTTLRLHPEVARTMAGDQYPITDIGVQTLTRRLIETLEAEQRQGDAVIEQFSDAKVDGRRCTFFRLTHAHRRAETSFRTAEIAFDKENSLPIYYRAVGWPTADEETPLLEEYSFRQLQLNVGLSESDFDPENPVYHFNVAQLRDVARSAEASPELIK